VSYRSAAPSRFPRRPALRLLIMGPPGAGKGTQTDAITAEFGMAISPGEIVRRNVAAGTPLGMRAQHVMASGGYIDDEITNAVVASRLAEDDARDGFLLDGDPRTLPQVSAVERLLAGQSTALTAVVVLVADPEVVSTRLLARADQQGRVDDTADAIRTRQQVYERETAPVLGTYRERRLLAALETSPRVQL
jgi:adenylate kinase